MVANVALVELDRVIEQQLAPLYYGRYVDDILLVMENGAACADTRVVDGTVLDEDRIDYLRDHLAAAERARAAGADLRAYVVWTLLDNFEWAEGYTKTFGIVHIALVYACRQHALGMAGTDALDRDAALDQAVIQER